MRSRILLLVVFVLSLGVSSAFADRKSYVWTYEYQTALKGRLEAEYYLTEEQKDIEKARPNIWKHYVELEYGITDHWDLSMYQMFKQTNTVSKSSFEYDGFKIRTRYRLAEKNKLPLDTLFYLEYIRSADFSKPNVLEGKIIFAKDIGEFNVAYNQIIKQELESGGITEHEYAAGLSYALTSRFRIGCETKGSYSGEKYYAGPSISFTVVPMKAFVAMGTVFGLNEGADDMQARMIVGVLF